MQKLLIRTASDWLGIPDMTQYSNVHELVGRALSGSPFHGTFRCCL
jgi:hypothetical protein